MNLFRRYFYLYPVRKTRSTKNNQEKTFFGNSLPQYAFLLLGITFQPIIENFHDGQALLFNIGPSGLIASMVIAILIFPAVYKASWDADKPIFVQLCTIFGVGVGWESIVGGFIS